MQLVRRVVLVVGICLLGDASLRAQTKDKPDQKTPPVKSHELLMGKWTATQKVNDTEVTIQLEFKKDGTILLSYKRPDQPRAVEGKYKFLDDDSFEVEYKRGETVTKEVTRFKVTDTDLELRDKDGKRNPLKLTRVK